MSVVHIAVSTGLAAVIGLLFIPPLIRLAHRFDLLDHPGKHKRHAVPVPVLGGAALFAAVWVAVVAAFVLAPGAFTDLRGSLLYVFFGALVIVFVGMSDDLTPLSAWVKLLAQVAAGIILYLGGLRIDPLTIPFVGPVEIGSLSMLITILWVVGLTNAINLIDGLDGLAAGVSLIAALTLTIVGEMLNVGGALVFAYALIGFLPVFWWFNRHPARIFLGDSGSMQIGYYFAVVSLVVPVKSFTAAALYVPLLALGVPILETGSSLVRRLISGRNVMQADRRHLFHFLSMAGLSPGRVILIFYSLSLTFGLFSLGMLLWNRRLVFSLLVLFMVVIFIAFLILVNNLPRSLGKNRRPGDSV